MMRPELTGAAFCGHAFRILLAALFCIPPARAEEPVKAAADSAASAFTARHPGARLIIGVCRPAVSRLYRYAGPSAPALPDSVDLYETGAVTETFTAVLFARLALTGQASFDAPLRQYLPPDLPVPVYQKVVCRPGEVIPDPALGQPKDDPGLRMQFTPYTCVPDPSEAPRPLLLCYLATHVSGLPEYPGNLKHRRNSSDPFAGYSRDDLADFLRGYHEPLPQEFEYRPSPLGTALLALALEHRMNREYGELLAGSVLRPMGLDMELSTSRPPARLVPGITGKNKPARSRTTGAFAPSFGLCATPQALVRFLEFNIRADKDSLVNVLDFTHNPRVLLPGGREQVALGWHVSPLTHDASMVWSSGVTGGYAAFIGFSETDHAGIVILCNAADDVSAMGKALLLRLLESR